METKPIPPAPTNVEKIIRPLSPGKFGAMSHRVQMFEAEVPGSMTKDDLQNPKLWASVSALMTPGCEIRCLADDFSFVAYGVCTYRNGTTVLVKINQMYQMDHVDDVELQPEDDYEVKLCGAKKWCIRNAVTGELVIENIATQELAYRELSDFKRALRA